MSRKMKDSGIEWIGEIPEDWNTKKLKYLAKLNMNSLKENTTKNYSFKYVDIGSVSFDNGIEKYEEIMFLDAPSRARRIVKKGDTIISTVRTYLKAITIIEEDENFIVSTGFAVLSPYNIEPKYLGYTCKSDYFVNTIEAKSYGVSYPAINAVEILEQKVTFPSITEQQKIATFLDKKVAEINHIIEKTKESVEEYKKYKQSIITEAVTKGLNPDVKLKDSGIEWIGEIPDHWRVTPIKYLKSNVYNAFVDGPFGSNLKSEHYVDNGDVYVIESGFITTGKFVFKEFKTITNKHFFTIKRSECKEHDVIIAKIGANYGMAGELPKLDKPSVVSGNSLKITLNQEKMLNTIFVKLLEIAKRNGGFISIVNENAQPALSLGSLNNFRLIVAPKKEQEEISKFIDNKCTIIDELVYKKEQLLLDLETYKKSLIYECVTGKREVI